MIVQSGETTVLRTATHSYFACCDERKVTSSIIEKNSAMCIAGKIEQKKEMPKSAAAGRDTTKIELKNNPREIVPQARATKSKTGQVQCWAHSRQGVRCTAKVTSREGEPIPIPYCARHLKSGDGALKVTYHPIAGKCLVARYDLPAKYRIAFWGERGRCPTSDKEDRSISFYPPNPETGSNRLPKSRNFKTDNYNGVLNPKDTGDVVHYAACPGPNERQNMRSTFQYWGKRHGEFGGLEFITLERIPKNHQLCHWYGSGWWEARDVKRIDVGTTKHPAPRRNCCTEQK